jgi:hypothetical protein
MLCLRYCLWAAAAQNSGAEGGKSLARFDRQMRLPDVSGKFFLRQIFCLREAVNFPGSMSISKYWGRVAAAQSSRAQRVRHSDQKKPHVLPSRATETDQLFVSQPGGEAKRKFDEAREFCRVDAYFRWVRGTSSPSGPGGQDSLL